MPYNENWGICSGVAGVFPEGDEGAGLAFAYAKGSKTSSQMVREVPINISELTAAARLEGKAGTKAHWVFQGCREGEGRGAESG